MYLNKTHDFIPQKCERISNKVLHTIPKINYNKSYVTEADQKKMDNFL